tara:strand:- start:1020 stop:1700 length:681 start_codon:yes stop_codon:yes gene_type:complete
MKYFLSIIILSFFLSSEAQKCETLTLDQEIQLTQNIALVTIGGIVNDSIEVNVIKKWKGDSILNSFLISKETLFSDYILFDSSKTYMMFWYNNLPVNKCSRTSQYKYVHFEYHLDIKFNGGKVVDVLTYDSLKYNKNNIFKTVKGVQYDQSEGNYAFYNLTSQTIQPFNKLPKETSKYNPIRYYEVDSNIKTSSTTYIKVFAVGKSSKEIAVTNKIKKEVLIGIYK